MYFLLCRYVFVNGVNIYFLMIIKVLLVLLSMSENESWSYLPTKYVTFHQIRSKQTRQFTNNAMAQLEAKNIISWRTF